jgi:hypothetical protein
VIAVQGGRFAGWSFYMTDGRLAYCHNWFDAERYYVKADDPLPTGEVTVQYQFDFDGRAPGAGGTGTLLVNGEVAGNVGESDRMPADRPIDGIDMSAFTLDDSETSGRDHFLYMGTDGKPISAKWKTMKVHFRYTESSSWIAPYIKPQISMVCDLISDPHETIELMQADLTAGWVIGAATAPLIALGQSAAQFPHVKVGEEDFNGYG